MSFLPSAALVLERALSTYAGQTAVVDGDRRVSYRALAERSARLANVLLEVAGKERPCAILLPNSLEYIEADVATARAGITRVGISERLSGDECAYIIEHSGASALISSPSMLERLPSSLPDAVKLVLLVNPQDVPAAPTIDAEVSGYEQALTMARPTMETPRVAPDSPAYILYTSGTTGRPKGATHTQAGRVAATVNMLSAELRLTPASGMIHAGGLTHGSGSKVIAFLATGGKNIIIPRFTPEHFVEAIKRHQGTHTFLVPTMIQWLEEAGPEVRKAVRGLTGISFGGAPITPALFRRAIEGFGPILTQVYGSCEVPHPVTVLRPEDYAADPSDRVLESAGRASWSTDVRAVDENGEDVVEGTAGEFLVRSDFMLRSYWADEAATADAITADGWYRSGDMATIDEDGLVTLRDRKRDMIITGGLNVYPTEVERVCAEHPAVRQVAVVGYPDETWGESVMAYIVPSEPGAASEDELIGWVRERLAGYKKPRRVEFRESLPLGSTGKVLKKELRAALWAEAVAADAATSSLHNG